MQCHIDHGNLWRVGLHQLQDRSTIVAGKALHAGSFQNAADSATQFPIRVRNHHPDTGNLGLLASREFDLEMRAAANATQSQPFPRKLCMIDPEASRTCRTSDNHQKTSVDISAAAGEEIPTKYCPVR
jgi:hypothetical protein